MKKRFKIILIISLGINIISILGGLFMFFKIDGVSNVSSKINKTELLYNENPYYIERTDLFSGIKLTENNTIFIGDSITQKGLWNELFKNENVINRGVNSDTTEGVKNRLTDVISSKPKRIFLMIGINDLYAGKTKQEISSNYEDILNQFKKRIPNTKVYIQSILPLNYNMFFAHDKIKNEYIKEVNANISKLAKKFGYEYIDVYSKVIKNGQLEKDLSHDGIHLSGKGYNVWKETIIKYIKITDINNQKQMKEDKILKQKSIKYNNKIWYAIGDSITVQDIYPKYLKDDLGLKSYVIDGDIGLQLGTMADRVTSKKLAKVDLVTVFGGTNDYRNGKELGTINDTGNIDTFYGNIQKVINKIRIANPKVELVFITPIKRGKFGDQPIYPAPNSKGIKLEQYVQAIKDVCSKNSIKVIDLFTLSGIDKSNLSIYTQDNLHPNEAGSKMIDLVIKKELEK